MRIGVIAAYIGLSLVGLCSANGARAASERIHTQIPPQALGTALKQFAQTRDMQVLYLSAAVKDLRTPGATGDLTADETLARLLNGTGLTYRYVNQDAITILPITGGSRSVTSAGHPAGTPAAGEAANKEGKTSSSAGFRVAQVAPGQAAGRSSVASRGAAAAGPAAVQLQEVIVTAEKRDERLQDVPVPVSVLNASTLTQSNQSRIQDYFSTVPGFSASPTGGIAGNQQVLAIRGISSGSFGNPTVGVTVDDVPFGGFTRELAPDIDPSDLKSIEVLRGPQGTLYGASSMGGLLKFVTVDPSPDRLSGHVEAGVDAVHHGAEPGYSFRGSANIPLSTDFAVRASAFTRRDAGYIDNPVLHEEGVNEGRSSGGRLSGLWRPSDSFSLKLAALYQKNTMNGLSDVVVQPGIGDLQQNYIRGAGGYDQEIQAYSAIGTARLGSANLVSVTGYNIYKFSGSLDYTYALGKSALAKFGVPGAEVISAGKTDKFSQEVRLSMPLGSRFDWLLGGFFTHENTPFAETLPAIDTNTGGSVGTLLFESVPIRHTEYAAFTDLTYHITDRLDIQLGGRESHLADHFEAVDESGALLARAVVFPEVDATNNVFTYLVTPRFRFSPHLMAYARVASGYRPSRSNSFNPDPAIPRAAKPDKTKNYEVGIKGETPDQLLAVDASVYYIDWKDIQINLQDASNLLSYFTNGSRAKSEGVELSLNAKPLPGLTIAVWGTYDDAVLTEGFPLNSAVYGPTGSRLPYSSKFSGSASVDDTFALGSMTGFVGATVSYVGDRFGTFVPTAARAYYPSYSKFDLRAGVDLNSWKVSLYVNNVADKRGVLGGGPGDFPPYAYELIGPRMIGISVGTSF